MYIATGKLRHPMRACVIYLYKRLCGIYIAQVIITYMSDSVKQQSRVRSTKLEVKFIFPFLCKTEQ